MKTPDEVGVSPTYSNTRSIYLECSNKSGQAGAGNTRTPGLTTDKEWLMSSVPKTRVVRRKPRVACSCADDHKALVLAHVKVAESGCWEWQRSLDVNGYGKQWHDSRMWPAHRLSFFAHKGPIPEGLVVDHLCRNTCCVNPDHLEAVTVRENTLRGNAAMCEPFPDDDSRHGTANGYNNLKCRCRPCTDAWAAYCLANKPKQGAGRPKVAKPLTAKQEIAVAHLRLAKEQLERSKRLRLHYVRLARENGLTYGEIGDALGVTEAAVRKLIERAA